METVTSYLGMRLPHPFIAGASPFGYRLDTIRRLEDAGCAAVVLHSLFEEQLTWSAHGRLARDAFAHGSSEVAALLPRADEYPHNPGEYLEHISRVKLAVGIPVIASLNGTNSESWLKYAGLIEQAGADALEVNMYEVVTDLTMPGGVVETRIAGAVRDLKRWLRVPVAIKLSPYFTSFGSVARQLDAAGADALVLFNRFYQPDIDIRTMTLKPEVELSTSAELRLRLHWLAILYGRIRPSLAVTGGVATPRDGIKAVLAGADVVQVVSALLRHGPACVETMRRELERWLDWQQLTLDEARGRAALLHTGDPTVVERAQYIRTLHGWAG